MTRGPWAEVRPSLFSQAAGAQALRKRAYGGALSTQGRLAAIRAVRLYQARPAKTLRFASWSVGKPLSL